MDSFPLLGLALLVGALVPGVWLVVERRKVARARAELAAERERLVKTLGETAAQLTAARAAEDRFRQVVDRSQHGVWAVDADGLTTYVNPRLQAMLGWPAERILGRPAREFVSEEDQERVEATWNERRRGVSDQREFVLRRADGTEVVVESHGVPHLDADGRFLGAFALLTDLSERRQAEAALRASEARKEAQFEVARALAGSRTIEDAAPRVLEAIGVHLGWDVGALWLPDPASGTLSCLAAWNRESAPAPEFVAVSRGISLGPGVDLPGRVHASGSTAWVAEVGQDPGFSRGPAAARAGLRTAYAFPVLHGGTCLAVAEFFRREATPPDPDLLHGFSAVAHQLAQFLERDRAEQERARMLERAIEARREAETANRAKDQFLATLSHELRTPLNAIVGWAHVLRSTHSDPATLTRGLDVIERNAKAQSRLIADVLDVSRIISGKLVLNVGEVDPARVVEAALDSLKPAAEARGLKLVSLLEPGAGPISGDPDRLQQVAWNLLSNAIKFTPEGGEIRVRLRRRESHVELTVSDNGPGIAPSFLPYIFERFRQADGSSTRTHGGLGLGLAIVRHLVELHGGTVEAKSDGTAKGSTFVVRLPVLLARAPVGGSTEAVAAPPERLDGLDVLVVDDEADGRDVAAAILERLGATVRTAASASEAWSSLEKQLPSVLISDVEMPDEDGYSLIRRLRNLPPDAGGRLPAAAFTAYARAEDRSQALAAGYDAHLSKPISPQELASVVALLARRPVAS
jgi:PAS domain S-box-containing protein